jgi:AcrR family transcriptional regulator
MKNGPATRGRPRSFDRDQALRRAMDLFAARGYDGVTIDDLQRAMGNISPPSFYAAFGSKDTLFREAVELYRATAADRVGEALSGGPIREAMTAMLRTAVETFLENEKAPGCLVVLGALHCTRTGKEAHDHLRTLRAQGTELIRRRLARAVDEGELPSGLPLADIAAFYTTVLHGLAVRAHDGATKVSLLATAGYAMAAWPALTAVSRPSAATRSRGSRPRPDR